MGKYYPVIVEGKYFDSVRQAAKKLCICAKYIHKRCKSNKWVEYYYTKWRIPKEKRCSTCRKIKPLTGFHAHYATRDKKATECIECQEGRVRKQRLDNPEMYRNQWLKRKYGITIDDYNDLFNNQNGLCAICKIHQSELDKLLSVDHDHETGKIRGLLCERCNTGLGMFKDDTNNLEEAVNYLKN